MDDLSDDPRPRAEPFVGTRRWPMVALLLFVGAAACSGGGGGGTSATTGSQLSVSATRLELGDGDQGDATFTVRNSGSGRLDYALSVDDGNGPPGWLAVAPTAGSSHGEAKLVTATVDRGLLAPDSYRGVVHVVAGGQRSDLAVALDLVGVQTDPADLAFGFGSGPLGVAVWNWGGGVLDFTVSGAPPWLTVDPPGGASSGRFDRQTLLLSVDRTGLAAGHYRAQLVIAPDAAQGNHVATLGVSVDVPSGGGDLDVAPPDPFASAGFAGGPFAPASRDYLLTNRGDAPLDWTAAATQPWLDLSSGGGTLAPGASTTVTASIDAAVAATLPPGSRHDAIAFTNATNGNGTTTRGAALAANDPKLVAAVYAPPNTMRIAPFTTLFSGIDSVEGDQPIVRWDWDFGDSGPRNPRTDEGKIVVHQFAAPGTYTVTLTVTDATGSSNSTTRDVVVDPFSGTTYYVSSSQGSDLNDGLSSGAPFRTLAHAFQQMANLQANHPDRLLLRRGDAWVFDAEIDPPTPSLLDAYDSGEAPLLEFTNPDTGLGWYGGSNGAPDDWGYAPTLSNLHLRHPVRNGSTWLVNAFMRGSTFRGCTIENGSITATLQSEGILLEDCEVSFGRHLGLYSSGDSVVCRRCTFTGSGSDDLHDHQIYLNNGARWLLEECLFDGAATGGNNNAAKLNGGRGVVVHRCEARGTRNGFDAGRNLEETGAPTADDYLFDECNSHDNGSNGQAAGLFVSWIGHVTVRNCVFHDHHPTSDGQGAIWLWNSNTTENHVYLYNNVFFSNSIPDVFMATPLYDLVMRNNVFLRDAAASGAGFLRLDDSAKMLPRVDADCDLFFCTGRSSADATFVLDARAANRSFDAWRGAEGKDLHGLFADPAFNDAPHLDFTLQIGSPAIDLGEALPAVLRDKSGVARPRGATYDAGIFER